MIDGKPSTVSRDDYNSFVMMGAHRIVSIAVLAIAFAAPSRTTDSAVLPFSKAFEFTDSWRAERKLEDGRAFELSVRLQAPEALPPNARIEVRYLKADPLYIFGIDYIKIIPDNGNGSLFTKDESGLDVIDPVTVAKEEIILMFSRRTHASLR